MQAVSNVLTALAELRNAIDVLEEQVEALPPEQSNVVPALRNWSRVKAPYLRGALTEAETTLGYDAIQRELNALASRQEYERDFVNLNDQRHLPRYYVDLRVGCVAVRDRSIKDEGPGLHSDMPSVIRFWPGSQVRVDDCVNWQVSDIDVLAARRHCEDFNKQFENSVVDQG